jgi:hypothetical protein
MYQFSPYVYYDVRILGSTRRIDELPAPRVFKLHEPAEYVYTPKSGKFIYVAREGMDVALSAFHHHMEVGNGTHDFNLFFDGFLRSSAWFKQVARWWELRNEPNVLFITFRDLKNRREETIRKIAAFLDVDLDDARLARTLERTGFEYMKKHENKFSHNEGVHWLLSLRTQRSFIRKGEMNAGAAALDEHQRARFAERYAKILGHTDLDLDR